MEQSWPKCFKYKQPDFYHFSDDSTKFSKEVFNYLNDKGLVVRRVMDICSGSGVIGIELLCRLKQFLYMDFIEIQKDFMKVFDENAKLFVGMASLSFHLMNFECLVNNHRFVNKYDLVLSNPPYFDMDKCRLSLNEKKRICRSFVYSNRETFYLSVLLVLKIGGFAFILSRQDDQKIIKLIAKKIDLIIETKILNNNNSSMIIFIHILDVN